MQRASESKTHVALLQRGLEMMEEVLHFQDYLYVLLQTLDKTHERYLEHSSGLCHFRLPHPYSITGLMNFTLFTVTCFQSPC